MASNLRYKILSNSDDEDLAKDVQSAMEDGWMLQAGVAVGYGNDTSIVFAQAMIKKKA